MSAIDAEVKIYTVAGRLIQSIQRSAITESFVRIPWDGRDRDGDELANGVYLYKVIAKTQDNRFSNEALGKLSINK
jgi:flagellar hook assembly protein FlgD